MSVPYRIREGLTCYDCDEARCICAQLEAKAIREQEWKDQIKALEDEYSGLSAYLDSLPEEAEEEIASVWKIMDGVEKDINAMKGTKYDACF